MEAATITPDANPISARCTTGFIFRFVKNTPAAPKDVPMKGIIIGAIIFMIIYHLISLC